MQSTLFLRRSLCALKRPIFKCDATATANACARIPAVFQQIQMQSTFSYVAVDHSYAYETAMNGLHGEQLKLAEMEGYGKDDPAFDPFSDDEWEDEDGKRGKDAKREEEAEDDNDEDDDSDDDDDDADLEKDDNIELNLKKIYKNNGFLRRKKSELATLRAGAPAGGMFAVVELAGTQHKVTTDDVLIVNRLKPLDTFRVGSIHTLKDEVMLVSSSHLTLVGLPYVSGAEVDVMVEEITKDAKVIIFKKRRRKNSKRKKGFRRDITMLRILDIRPPAEYIDHAHRERPDPEL